MRDAAQRRHSPNLPAAVFPMMRETTMRNATTRTATALQPRTLMCGKGRMRCRQPLIPC